MDNYLHLPFLRSFPIGLVITRYPEKLVVVSIIPWAYCLAVLVTWIPLRLILAFIEYPLIPQLFMCYTKVFGIPPDIPKILSNLLLWNFLFAFIMNNPISIEILLTFLVIIILSLLTQYVANASNHQLILLNYLSSSDVFQTWAGSRPNYLSSIVPLVYSIDPSLIRTSASDPLFWKS